MLNVYSKRGACGTKRQGINNHDHIIQVLNKCSTEEDTNMDSFLINEHWLRKKCLCKGLLTYLCLSEEVEIQKSPAFYRYVTADLLCGFLLLLSLPSFPCNAINILSAWSHDPHCVVSRYSDVLHDFLTLCLGCVDYRFFKVFWRVFEVVVIQSRVCVKHSFIFLLCGWNNLAYNDIVKEDWVIGFPCSHKGNKLWVEMLFLKCFKVLFFFLNYTLAPPLCPALFSFMLAMVMIIHCIILMGMVEQQLLSIN